MARTRKVAPGETARDKFVRLGNARANKVLNAIESFGKLSAPTYQYGDDDVTRAFDLFEATLATARQRFEAPTATGKPKSLSVFES